MRNIITFHSIETLPAMLMNIRTYILPIVIFAMTNCQTDMNLIEETTNTGVKFTYEPKDAVFSDFYIRFIPNRPDLLITKEQTIQIINLLEDNFQDKIITATLDSSISFVDCGANLEEIKCQHCGKILEPGYWQDLMDSAYENHFTDLSFTTKCCDSLSDLNLLNYNSAFGFAKSIIEINNPDYNKVISSNLLIKFKEIANVDFKLITSKY